MSSFILVLDANIIIRAVLGKKVKNLIIENSERVDFFTPDVCFDDALEHLPAIFEKRGFTGNDLKELIKTSFEILHSVKSFFRIIDHAIYQERMIEAQKRIKSTDIEDWPVVATALLFNCPIWTEDRDFFGVGLPTWTIDRIPIFFNALKEKARLHSESAILLNES